jgi:SagB-type dehydrogenase family enzyme
VGATSPDAPATVRLCALSEDALLEEDPASGSLVVISRWGELRLDAADAAERNLLRRMRLGPVSIGNVVAARPGTAPARDVDADRATAVGAGPDAGLDGLLDRLSGAVVHALGLTDGLAPLLSAVPVTAEPAFRPDPVRPDQVVQLSRFAAVRRLAGVPVVESPRAPYRVVLHEQSAARVATGLATATRLPALAALAGLAVPVVADIVAFLVAAGVVVEVGEDGQTPDDAPVCRLWTYHELLFHVRTRTAHRDGEVAAEDPPGRNRAPVTKRPPAGRRFPLHRPDPGRLAQTDPTLTELLEHDHACPRFTTAQLTAAQLGELLFRAARVRAMGPAHSALGAGDDEASQRPYVSIAGRYELELYLTVNRCADLPKGIYHYDPAEHALTLLRDDPAALNALLDLARVAAANSRRPAALITVTARMERVAPVFGGAAYATALMHVGALQQTLYLCALAMGLSAHPVTADASDTVDRLLGLQWPAEIGVGECVVDLATESGADGPSVAGDRSIA